MKKFYGIKEITNSTWEKLNDEEKNGYLWFVQTIDELAKSGDVYFNTKHYGHVDYIKTKDNAKGLLINRGDELSCSVGDYKFWVRKNLNNNLASIGLSTVDNETISTFWSYSQTFGDGSCQWRNRNENININGNIMDNDLGYERGGTVYGFIMNKTNQELYTFNCIVTHITNYGMADMAVITIEKLT